MEAQNPSFGILLRKFLVASELKIWYVGMCRYLTRKFDDSSPLSPIAIIKL